MTDIGLNNRLHGARLAEGIVYLRDAAVLLAVNEATYRHAEKGIRSVSENIVASAAGAFGVSRGYLQGAEPMTPKEKLADRIGGVLNDVDVDQYESPKGYALILERLRAIRQAKGHDTANAAAEAHGWNRTVYWQHETGGRGVTLDRLIAYCLSMGARPEFGVLGLEPAREAENIEWQEKPRAEPEPATGSAPPTPPAR